MLWSYMLSVTLPFFSIAAGNGLLLLYRPKDISNECVFSHHLRYDLSFGMGMSDTITLVFRTLNEIDYECMIEIVTESKYIYLLVVIKFPNNIVTNCKHNQDGFAVLKKDKCLRLCDLVGGRDIYTPYFVISVRERIRFHFTSNSSINTDINADLYQVTTTSARKKPRGKSCNRGNETVCVVDDTEFCFTSGVVCDGIKNCGASDWFDERKSECGLPVQRLGFAPVIAVIAVIMCTLLAASHILLQCLPPLASSFFIFNANEDNRLCIDTVFHSPTNNFSEAEKVKRMSLIPVFSSSSSDNSGEDRGTKTIDQELQSLSTIVASSQLPEDNKKGSRQKHTMKSVTAKIQEKIRFVTGRARQSGIVSTQKEQFDV